MREGELSKGRLALLLNLPALAGLLLILAYPIAFTVIAIVTTLFLLPETRGQPLDAQDGVA